MQCPDFPPNEQERLNALQDTGLLDSLPEERFDRLTRLAKQLFKVPYALVSLVDADRQWFKSNQGIDAAETGRDVSFCGHTILKDDIFEIPDATLDPRFADNPLVTGYPEIRFYAGAPVYNEEGFPLGTLCIIDTKPRQLSKDERQSLTDLASCVTNEIASDVAKSVFKERELQKQGPFINVECSADEHLFVRYISNNVERILGYSATELIDQRIKLTDLIHPKDLKRHANDISKFILGTETAQEQSFRLKTSRGKFRWFSGYLHAERKPNGEATSISAHLVDQTRLKINERSLNEERRRLADIIEGTRVGTWEWNVQTGETRFNNRWAEIVGYDLSELEPTNIQTWSDLAHPDDLEISNALLTEVLEGRCEYYDAECRMKHKDGHWVWIHDRGKVVARSVDGTPLWMSGTHADISEKKQAEIELHTISDFQNLVFENLPVYLFVKDEKFNIVMANGRFIDLYPEDQQDKIIGYTTIESYSEEERTAFLNEDKRAFDTGYSETEETIKCPDGIKRTLSTKKIRFENPSGEKFILGLGTDITQVKKQQAVSENLKKNLILSKDAAGLGVFIWDVINDKLSVDEKISELYGLSKGALEEGGISVWLNAIHPEDRHRVEKDLHNALDDKKNYDTTFRVIKPSGEVVHIKAAGLVEYDDSGQPVQMIRTNLDITSLKRTEEALIKAKQNAESATKSKSEFLANMSHEIRTPINGILGMLNLSIKESTSPSKQRRLTLAKESASTLLTIVNDILDFSKIEAGKLTFETIDFDLLKLLENFAHANAQPAHDKGLELVLDIQNMPQRSVKGDPNRLKQILNNLLSNAVKFTEKGRIRIDADLQQQAEDRLALQCSVIDSGIGIPDVKLSSIFDNFTQADSSTTRLYGGSGLGLSIAQYLCEKMGGHIAVESKLGEGSKFTFSIQLEKSTVAIDERIKNSSEDRSVLLLESHDESKDVIHQTLEGWGLKVFAFSRVQDFISEHRSDLSFDTVLLDQKLVNFFVKEVLTHPSTALDYWKHTKITILGNSHINSSSFNLDQLKVHGALMKPVTQSDLWDAVVSKESLAQSRQEQGKQNPSAIKFDDTVKILLVEDNAINREVAGDYLDDAGLRYECAKNGEDAIDKLLTYHDFNLILMDCQMPLLDGYEATKWIRVGKAGDQYKDIPIIALTANAMQGDKEKCLSAGMNDYLSKPIAPEALIQKIAEIIQQPEVISMGSASESTSTQLESNAVWDREALLNRVRGKEERLERLLTLFIDEAPQREQALSELENELNLEKATFFTHSLKGNAATLSCQLLSDIAKQAEHASRDGDADKVKALLPEIRLEFEKVSETFRAYLP